jgi:hypothetical protein
MSLTDLVKDNVKREQIEDFVKRYDQGKPADGISDQEAQQQYDQVTAQLDDKEYEQSAKDSFERLDPQERREAGQELGVGETDDPGELAKATTKVRKEQPDLLNDLMSNPAVKGAVAGIAASAAKRVLKR